MMINIDAIQFVALIGIGFCVGSLARLKWSQHKGLMLKQRQK
jgi:hypothetical protein